MGKIAQDPEEKRKRPYKVVSYNSDWKKRFNKEKEIIASVFKDKALCIEHVGSTAVEGMWAKPQIDILVMVEVLSDVDKEIHMAMKGAGYRYHRGFEQFNERYFTRDAESGERLTSVHIYRADDHQAKSKLYFRDYLREHPEAQKRYSAEKKQIYKEGVDRADYSRKKQELMQELIKEAEKWHQNTTT